MVFMPLGDKPRRTRVLVADDNHDILTLFCELLKLNEFDVVARAQSGKEAADHYSRQRPDIVFLDVVMPDGDGIYALEKIREMNPDAIVIMVTSNLAPTTSERLRQLRAYAVVYKTFDIDEIIRVVNSTMPSGGLKQIKFSQ